MVILPKAKIGFVQKMLANLRMVDQVFLLVAWRFTAAVLFAPSPLESLSTVLQTCQDKICDMH